jgi:hypothetical protein
MVLGLGGIYPGLAGNRLPAETFALSSRLVLRMIGVSVLALAGLYVFVRVFVRWN